MKKPIIIIHGTPKLPSKNPNFFIKNHKKGFLKLSLPLMVPFWLPFLVLFSTFIFNHGNEGNVVSRNRNLTNTSSYPFFEDQSQNLTNRLLLEFNVSASAVFNYTTSQNHTFVDTEHNPPQGTSPVEDVASKVLGYPTLVCESENYVDKKQEEVKTERTHLGYLNLDEFRNITKQDNNRLSGAPSGLVNITHRLEPDGTEYDYASASKGAKVVAHNKEVKGASNILGEDHDKYLRNPCSVLEKYVVIELAEETLVDAVKISNFEHHSSNFKRFDLSGSLVFPTDTWYPLGSFVAENVKHHQYFKLPEPKWARYLRLSLVSHYGSEFYCTLNVIKVYGIDAIERMLEDLIVTPEGSTRPKSNPNSTEAASGLAQSGNGKCEGDVKNVVEGASKKIERVDDDDTPKSKKPDLTKIPEPLAKGNGRIHGDAVLKILMQKIRLIEKNLSLLEDYIKELNKRQEDVLPHLDVELVNYSATLEKTRTEIKDLLQWKETMEKEIANLRSWKASVSSHLESIIKENSMLRKDIDKVSKDQESLNKAELMVLTLTLSFAIVALFKIVSFRFLKISS